ncbi:hypothetical protein CA983_21305 [Streptomyces swartbergensis]|uniref:Uncharacterized protein n=1 Tax=Streptomyces swartbergensis TaxID=487165 RepID=A0A243S2W1_9ACTN|nr:hypothetical protein CA983_21305 [Streptomyces swartbergensis]
MAHIPAPHSGSPTPRPDVALARGCERCNGWGTVVTPEGRHELCAACQQPTSAPPPAVTAPNS